MYFSLHSPLLLHNQPTYFLHSPAKLKKKTFSLLSFSLLLKGHITLVIKCNGYLFETDGQAWLRIHLTTLYSRLAHHHFCCPLIAQHIYIGEYILYTMATNQQRPLATNFGTRTHNQSILFIKGRYIRKMELVRVYTKCILSQREIALYTIHTNINYSYILKCHLHFSVPPIQLTRATHKTNNVCLQHFGLGRILHFSSILKQNSLPSF